MPTTKIDRLEARYRDTEKQIERWQKKLTEAQDTIAKAIPALRQLYRAGKRQHLAIRDAKKVARAAKNAPPESGLNDSIGL